MTFKLTYCDIQTALLGHSHLRQTRVCLRWAGANMEADFESDLAHALALSQEEAPVETAATEADAGIRPLLKKFKADVDADTECPICLSPFYPRAQVTACPQCFSGVTHAGYCTMALKDAPMLLTRATGDTDDELSP